MKTRFTVILLALALCVSYGNGQDDQVSSRLHLDSMLARPENRGGSSSITLGIGVSVGFGGAGEVSICFPITTGEHFRIEPDLGVFDASVGLPPSQHAPFLGKLGVGVFYALRLRGPNSRVYAGARIARLTVGNLFLPDEISGYSYRTGYLVAPSAGIELGSSHFTLGVELGLNYIRIKDYNEIIYPPDSGPTVSPDVITGSGLFGEGRLFLRAYL